MITLPGLEFLLQKAQTQLIAKNREVFLTALREFAATIPARAAAAAAGVDGVVSSSAAAGATGGAAAPAAVGGAVAAAAAPPMAMISLSSFGGQTIPYDVTTMAPRYVRARARACAC